ncbi:S-formylglutathione hydrolase [Aetokthonos hydrillicola Thurmond2011]|jgi:S-formylglutathione hydrolase|uniref:S-formylglutathione hydrolase n=1 Tax=Aetokthonos hydrillicola Thurmond2011 TaxID=2712845 RepID=A0AAP5I628_9CYAN|nr:S-formylglutathione hydrolase [Aetokthonos hydrillicola]MBW4583620.1 S-formylglutathione hydrolase [Aetokthonos hydrillicola CCALA 1050]MDR9895687.1 S-formylglutathione hydrolase [Aetokthonos hydrillicola Thurmond2011]
MVDLILNSEYKCFGGKVSFYRHSSSTCNGEMRFAVYQPPQATQEPVPVLYFLSGLTCTEENFMVKAGAQQYAAKYGLMLVAPDTSPRNTGISGEDDEWDFGSGAGFYVDATVEPWASHYKMYSYVVDELPTLITKHFPVQSDKQGIFGHSMGGHGAIVCALRNPNQYKSVSAFAPIAAPMSCAWGQKAFSRYLGENQETWRVYDASELVSQRKYNSPILIDQGTADKFLKDQLYPDVFEQACTKANQPLNLRYQEGYDHSYYFISSFIEDHIRHHTFALK